MHYALVFARAARSARRVAIMGAYRYMRHPIYTSLFIVYLSIALRVIQSAERCDDCDWDVLVCAEEHCGREISPGRSAIRGVHAKGTSAMDPVRDLNVLQGKLNLRAAAADGEDDVEVCIASGFGIVRDGFGDGARFDVELRRLLRELGRKRNSAEPEPSAAHVGWQIASR